MDVAVDLLFADGRRATSIRAESEFTLGRSERATIQVSEIAELADVQLMMIPRPEGIWISDNDEARVQALRGGKPLGSCVVPWGTELDIGSLTVRVRRHHAATRKQHTNPTLLVIVALAGTVAVAVMLDRAPPSSLPTTTARPPALFDDQPRPCPDPARAQLHGLRAAFEASAKEQRYPFAPQDGLAAVELYRLAAACLAEAKLDAQAMGANALGRELRRKLEDEYRALVITQRRSLRKDDSAGALIATIGLRGLVGSQAGEYGRWLANLEAELVRRNAAQSKNGSGGKLRGNKP
jgi:hypothetical protein